MPNPNYATITVSAPPRGSSSQNPIVFSARECVATWSWGLQPATALIDWVSATQQPAIVPLASLQIDVGGHTFYGFCTTVVPKFGTDGISLMQEFVDNRELLQWDTVFGAFNMPEHRIVNGQFIRRYWHILPADFSTGTKTYSNTPYTAQQVLDFLFNASTVFTPWSRVYYVGMNEIPIYALDFTNGTKLGTAIQQISDAMGMVFTLFGGPLTLVWTLKGIGTVPAFPVNSDNQRSGTAISGNPLAITVVGDRNKYQVLQCPMTPDWLPEWQTEFWDFSLFIRDIFLNCQTPGPIGGIPAGTPYSNVPGDEDGIIGYQLATARAYTITVAQYADLRDARNGDGNLFRDYRRFQDRSRLQLPVKLYLDTLMFRAFCFSPDFTIRVSNGLFAPLTALNLVSQAIVEVTHDPETGVMTALTGAPPPSDHNGYAIVQGFQVASDGFKTLNPDYFSLSDWVSNANLWQAMPFEIDDSGEGDQFVIFDQPVIQTGNLINAISIDGTPQTYPDDRPRVALNVSASLAVPPVQSAVTFLAEKFTATGGDVVKTDIENVPGLNGEFVGNFNGILPTEMVYADGQTALQKANVLINNLLNRQYLYQYGGYTVKGSNATQLSSVIDRVTVRLGPDGLTEEVDFTTERSRNVIYNNGFAQIHTEPEREFERRAELDPLFPGQDDLREQARQMQLAAALLKANPKILSGLVNTFHLLMGLDSPPETVMMAGNPTGTLNAGTPLYREADDNSVSQIDNTGSEPMINPVFAGVTVMDGEHTDAGIRVTKLGSGGVVQARVKCDQALAKGTIVGLPSDMSPTDSFEAGPSLAVGELEDDFSDLSGDQLGKVYLARVRVTGGSGGMNLASPMEYDMTQAYGGQIWVHVAEDNDAVLTGTIDPDSGQPVKSSPGWYCSRASGVPIEGTADSPQYHIPQNPVPDAEDIDDDINYWVIFVADAQCS